MRVRSALHARRSDAGAASSVRASRAGALILAALAAVAGCAEPGVVRVLDGREVEGRFIDERAYALYAVASEAEARGDRALALRAYEAAAEEDPESPEIWTRVGAVRCSPDADGRVARGPAEEAFDRAQSRDEEYEPLWRERARCALAAGHAEEARVAAARAEALDPNRDETVVLHAQALEKSGRPDAARRALVALTLRHERSVPAWRALADLARRTGDADLAESASRTLARLTRGTTPDPRPAPPGALAEVDAALLRGDLAAARRRGTVARLPAAELALRAAALGRVEAARAQAELVLGADPGDAAARIALAVAADLAADEATVVRVLRELPSARDASLVAASPLARLLYAELLQRRVGAEAARAFLGGARPEPAGGDGLIQRVDRRLQARLGTPPAVH